MENYYKDRKKQQTLFSKKIKKMSETGDQDLSRVKKEYVKWSIRPPNYERGEYWSEDEVIKELTRKIQEAQEELITLQFDFCYHLSNESDTFDVLEKTIAKMVKTRTKIFTDKNNREQAELKKRAAIQGELKALSDNHSFLEIEDKKANYRQMKELSSQLVHPTSQVIAYEIEHKELEYRLTQLYEPLTLIKIS